MTSNKTTTYQLQHTPGHGRHDHRVTELMARVAEKLSGSSRSLYAALGYAGHAVGETVTPRGQKRELAEALRAARADMGRVDARVSVVRAR